mmetsp:Transcript_136925/g.237961  ORF Transcript_136925/g.237961 Transcript_136925/m.237961 type:complete len:82 (+) Transcript_136925:1308-1553(+)
MRRTESSAVDPGGWGQMCSPRNPPKRPPLPPHPWSERQWAGMRASVCASVGIPSCTHMCVHDRLVTPGAWNPVRWGLPTHT